MKKPTNIEKYRYSRSIVEHPVKEYLINALDEVACSKNCALVKEQRQRVCMIMGIIDWFEIYLELQRRKIDGCN